MQVSKNTPCFHKCKKLPKNDIFLNFQVCVYVRKQPESTTMLRNRYLRCIGGQNVIFCKTHKVPLILNPVNKRPKTITTRHEENDEIKSCHCCCDRNSCLDALLQKTWTAVSVFCGKEGSLVCSHVNCSVAICNKHFTSIMINAEDSIYMLEKGSCSVGSLELIIATQASNIEEDNDDSSLDTASTESLHNLNPLSSQKNCNDIDNFGPCDGYEYAGQLLEEFDEYDSDDSQQSESKRIQNFLTTNMATAMLGVYSLMHLMRLHHVPFMYFSTSKDICLFETSPSYV